MRRIETRPNSICIHIEAPLCRSCHGDLSDLVEVRAKIIKEASGVILLSSDCEFRAKP